MKNVLIIDDEPDIAEIIKSAIEDGIAGSVCTIQGDFEGADDCIARLRPEAIVLDLMEGHQSSELPGQRTWSSVWEDTFCPVVIYTGSEADLEPPVPADHPFVRRIQKGSGTEAQVVDALREFAPAVESVCQLRTEIDEVIHKVLRDTAGAGLMPMDDVSYLLHAGRRRIAATMDDPTITSSRAMASWEQYLVPAIGESLLTADLLRERGAEWDNPTAYRIVLTPSCDLNAGRCVETVLVAKCQKGAELVNTMSVSVKLKKRADSAERLRKNALTPGVFEGFIPLPPFGDLIPSLVANLKDLDVLKTESIAPADPSVPGFDRIASIDSPFREQVVWAYLTTAARPGMPDRELEPWATQLITDASSTEAT